LERSNLAAKLAFCYSWNVPLERLNEKYCRTTPLSSDRRPAAPARPTRRRARATIVDVAERAGVSKSLVSLVLTGSASVSPESRAAILEAVEALQYRPNAMARSLARQRSRMLGVLVSDLRNPFFGDIVSGLQARAGELDYTLVFTTGERDPEREVRVIDAMLELRVDGLVLAAPRVPDELLDRVGKEVPTVVLNRRIETDACDSVTNDDGLGGRIVVEHLAALGHRRIAHIDGGAGAGAAPRRAGFVAAMRAQGLAREAQVVEGSYTEEGGYHGGRELLRRGARPTAVFAANDLAAIGVLSAVEEAGWSVPADVSLVGYDNSSLASLRHLSFTSVDQSAPELGSMAIERLAERIGGRLEARHETVEPRLVVRSSTAKAPRAKKGS
jgi:DNA-binding LacI/PurR family transcriptional regulator